MTESLRSPKVRRYLPSYGEKEDILLRLLSEEIGHVRKALAKSMLEHKWIKRAGTRERKFGDYSNSGNLYKLAGLGKQIAMRAQKLRENQEETSTVETEQRLARSRIEKVLKELEAEEKDIAYFRTALFALLMNHYQDNHQDEDALRAYALEQWNRLKKIPTPASTAAPDLSRSAPR